jgi:hypothetical protein
MPGARLCNGKGTPMKVIIAALTAVSVLAGATAPAGAGPSSEATQAYEVKTRYVKKKYKKRRYRDGYYIQYWADKLPTGSSVWWQQMDREGRGGRRQ